MNHPFSLLPRIANTLMAHCARRLEVGKSELLSVDAETSMTSQNLLDARQLTSMKLHLNSNSSPSASFSSAAKRRSNLINSNLSESTSPRKLPPNVLSQQRPTNTRTLHSRTNPPHWPFSPTFELTTIR